MRFATIANSISAPGSFGPVGLRDINPRDKRMMFQLDGSGNFAARVFATLAFDFSTNSALASWVDVTHRTRRTDDAAAESDWTIVGSKYQRRSQGSLDDPLISYGLYAFDNDFFPAAIMWNVSSVSSGDAMAIHFGV
jgi:hypothetical protein